LRGKIEGYHLRKNEDLTDAVSGIKEPGLKASTGELFERRTREDASF